MSDNKLIKSFVSAWRVRVYPVMDGNYGVYIEHEDFGGHKEDKLVSAELFPGAKRGVDWHERYFSSKANAAECGRIVAAILGAVLEIISSNER